MDRLKPALYWIYLRDYFFLAFLVSLLCWYIVALRGPAGLGIVLLVKLFLMGLTYWFHQRRKQKEIYFYLNNGIGFWQLLMAGLLIDLVHQDQSSVQL
jgi:hypothetical protein